MTNIKYRKDIVIRLLNTKLKKDLLFSYFTQVITIGLGFLQLFLINKYFGVITFGQLTIIVSIVGIFNSLLTARSSEAVTRFFKREELNKNYENAKFILFIGFGIDFVTAILFMVLIYFTSSFVATMLLKDIDLRDEIIIYSFITFIVFLRGSMIGFLQSKEMFVNINIISIIESLVKILFLLLFIFALHQANLKTIIYSFLIASIFSFFYTFYIFFRNYTEEFNNINLVINKVILKEYWNFNLKTFFSSSLKAGSQNIDNLIIGYFLNAEIVGVYQVIKKILSPILIISSPFSILVYPKLIYFFETNQKKKFINIIIKISLYIFSFSIIYIFISYNLLDSILEIMNVNFNKNYNMYFLLISLLILLNSQMWWVRAFSNTVNPNYSIYMNVFATIYQLTITVFMSKFYELYGMIISLIFMNIFILGFWLIKGYKYVYTYIHTYIIKFKNWLINLEFTN